MEYSVVQGLADLMSWRNPRGAGHDDPVDVARLPVTGTAHAGAGEDSHDDEDWDGEEEDAYGGKDFTVNTLPKAERRRREAKARAKARTRANKQAASALAAGAAGADGAKLPATAAAEGHAGKAELEDEEAPGASQLPAGQDADRARGTSSTMANAAGKAAAAAAASTKPRRVRSGAREVPGAPFLRRESPVCFCIPQGHTEGMRVPARFFASPALLELLVDEIGNAAGGFTAAVQQVRRATRGSC
jgi:hypothetical protein